MIREVRGSRKVKESEDRVEGLGFGNKEVIRDLGEGRFGGKRGAEARLLLANRRVGGEDAKAT